MKIVLLTTDTIHHLFFASRIQIIYSISAIILEKRKSESPNQPIHILDYEQNKYEEQVFLTHLGKTFSDIAESHEIFDINGRECLHILKAFSPDVIIVFGTGMISDEIIQSASIACLNLHGGNPEEYRGLDSHLWAIYHKDFSNLITTLHKVESTLDTGDVVLQAQVPITKRTKIYQIRALNTEVCISLVLLCLSSLERLNWIPSRNQLKRGRYYSSIPAVLKDTCMKNFENYVISL